MRPPHLARLARSPTPWGSFSAGRYLYALTESTARQCSLQGAAVRESGPSSGVTPRAFRAFPGARVCPRRPCQTGFRGRGQGDATGPHVESGAAVRAGASPAKDLLQLAPSTTGARASGRTRRPPGRACSKAAPGPRTPGYQSAPSDHERSWPTFSRGFPLPDLSRFRRPGIIPRMARSPLRRKRTNRGGWSRTFAQRS